MILKLLEVYAERQHLFLNYTRLSKNTFILLKIGFCFYSRFKANLQGIQSAYAVSIVVYC